MFYIPVILVAISSGARGALLAAGVVSIGYLPHLYQLARAGDRVLDHAAELALLPVLGLIVGRFADRSRRLQVVAREHGRLAALGEVGTAVMAQLEGPLASIAGQSEVLSLNARWFGASSLGFASDVIRAEVERMQRLLRDLRSLDPDRGHGRFARVNLRALLTEIVEGAAPGAGGGFRLRLAAGPVPAFIRTEGRALAQSLRLIFTGLLEALPWVRFEVRLIQEPSEVVIEIEAQSDSRPLPEPWQELRTVFGARTSDYHFEQALCVHILTTLGAGVACHRDSPRRVRLQVRFPTDRLNTLTAPESLPVMLQPRKGT